MPVPVRLLPLALLLLLTACGGPAPTLPPLPPDATLLAFGDSLTFGTGAARSRSYPAELERLIGRKVLNEGSPGEVSEEGARRLPALLDRHRPDLLLLCHGGNDLLQGRDGQAIEENVGAMLKAARERGVPVLLIGVPKPGLWLRSDRLYRRLADRFEVPLEEQVIAEVESDRRLKSDPIHPNAEGYRRIAETIAARLDEWGAL